MDVEIVKKDGSKYRLSDFGVVYDFVVGSISMESYVDRSTEGRHGGIDYGADYSSRIITVPMKFKHNTMHDYAHLRDHLYGILTDSDSYYIRELRRPKRLEYEFIDFGGEAKRKSQTENRYVNGKQYLVRMVNELTPEQLFNGGEIDIEFETTELPFAETIYTTQTIQESGYRSTVEKYGLVDGVNIDYMNYSPTTPEFVIWNGGNMAIDPFNMSLYIQIRYVSTDGGLILENITTGDKFIYKEPLEGSHVTFYDSVIHKADTNALRETNREFITLAPGVNRFKISGGSFESVKFDFPFYYK